MRWSHLVLLGLLTGSAEARVYQWTDPDTGSVYLSGSPPGWYRAGTRGPRVLVFEAGKLVDDTGRATSEEEARALRDRALEEAERRRQAEAAAREAALAVPTEEAQTPPAEADTSASARAQAEAAFANYLKTLVNDYFRMPQGGETPGPTAPAAPQSGP